MTYVALGDRAIRFARPASVASRALVEAVARWPGVVDVVIARHDVAAYFAGPIADDLADRIAALARLGDVATPAREIALRAVYDGPDLDEVARSCGLTTGEVIHVHASALYEVDTLGFAPGFAYLIGLDPRLRVPRRATPRARVPAGALAIAGEYTAVYPFASPGGWHLIGRVDEAMFDPDRGARLRLGDRVRFAR